jgi:ATPase subunit of ABC transporter with duplicated ATPase domains
METPSKKLKFSDDEWPMEEDQTGTAFSVASVGPVVVENASVNREEKAGSTDPDVVEEQSRSSDAGSLGSNDPSSIRENNEMDVESEDSSVDVNVPDTVIHDLLEIDKLVQYLEQGKKAGDKIAGKDVLLLIGGTGAGKSKFVCLLLFGLEGPHQTQAQVAVAVAVALQQQRHCILRA